MAKYCKNCQCPVNQINSDYCLFCKKGCELYSDIEKLKIMDPKRYNELFNKGE